MGRKVDFKNTIIIMTSNVGSRELKDFGQDVGFSTSATAAGKDKKTQKILETALKNQFPPEFLNRIDDTIMFTPLNESEIRQIVNLQLNNVKRMLHDNGVELEVTDDALNYLADVGFDPEFGARPVKRAIQDYMLNELSRKLLGEEIDRTKPIIVDSFGEGLVFRN